jgi:hypothetical protein
MLGKAIKRIRSKDDEKKDMLFDIHEVIYGLKADEIKYGEYCDICNSRIDETGLCACGAGSG